MDVKSLYTNIRHTEGIQSVAKALEDRKEENTSTRVIIKFLSLVLYLNNFIFNDQHYKQNTGCTMGSKCYPSYANIFMDWFERKYIYPRIKHKHVAYYRFIDDIFFIWTGSEPELLKFFHEINSVHDTIKFECNHSNKSKTF